MVNRFFYPTVAIHAGALAVAFLALSSESVSSLSGQKRGVQQAAMNISAKGNQKPNAKKSVKTLRRMPPNTVRLVSSEDSGKLN